MKRLVFVLLLVGFALPARSQESARDDNQMSLDGRHIISVGGGLMSGSVETRGSGGNLSTDIESGAVGFLGYSYGVRPDLTLGVSIGLLDSRVSTSITSGSVDSESSVVSPILFGVTYYPPALAISRVVCPFVAVSAGPYVGSATNSRVGSQIVSRTFSETVVGSRLAGGVDWFVSRRVKVGAAGGYHFVGEFSEPIGRSDNYSGPEFSVGLGVVLGG